MRISHEFFDKIPVGRDNKVKGWICEELGKKREEG